MFWKSLQLRLILIFVILIVTIISGIGIFSMAKIEQVYYTGFIDEMLNNISGYNINIGGNRRNEIELLPTQQGPKLVKKVNLEEFYNNFKIYFSLNNATRYGVILNSEYEDVITKRVYTLTDVAKKCIRDAEASPNRYAVRDDGDDFCYLFAYIIELNDVEGGKIILLISQSKSYINNQLNQIRGLYFLTVGVIIFITLVIAIITGRSITKPIELLTNKAELMASGNISLVTVTDKQKAGYEISRLIDTFNLMMEQIQNNMNEISSEKNRLETILMHLTDGVLAFNISGRLTHANLAAKKMLGFESAKTFEDVFGKFNIDVNIEKIVYLEDWTSTDTVISNDGKYLNVFFAPFRNEQDKPTGIIVVIHDGTKQAKLDDMRKEFVSNVSHELKTPLTSIKTYTETLLEEDDLDDENKNKFLNVILSEANRMTRLVSDLLQLTKFDYKKLHGINLTLMLLNLQNKYAKSIKYKLKRKNNY